MLFLCIVPSSWSDPSLFSLFSDSKGSSQVSALNWGVLNVGETATKTIYVQNLDTNDLIQMTYYMENLSPQNAEGFLHLEGKPVSFSLKPNDVAKIDLTLSVDSTIENVDSFSFDIVFVAGFGEMVSEGDSTSGSSGIDGGEYGFTDEDSVTVPSEDNKTGNYDDLILVVIVCLFVYFAFGKNR